MKHNYSEIYSSRKPPKNTSQPVLFEIGEIGVVKNCVDRCDFLVPQKIIILAEAWSGQQIFFLSSVCLISVPSRIIEFHTGHLPN